MVHRYVEPKDVNGFKGEFIVLSDGDYDVIDVETFKRLLNAKDYVIGFYEDDICFDNKKGIEEEYEDFSGNGVVSFFDWLRGRCILFILLANDSDKVGG